LRTRLDGAVEAIRRRTNVKPSVSIVLGSGLGALADCVADAERIPYDAVPGMPSVRVQGHRGELVIGTLGGISVVLFAGRVHHYEGHAPEEVVFGVRLGRLLGASTQFLTNAAGGINPAFSPGDLMIITDQIHFLSGCNPLRGPNLSSLGDRFPDMSALYDGELRGVLRAAAKDVGVILREGVYCGLSGPNYETPAEIRALERLGADAVGMSTTAEAIAARHAGMRVMGISCISNLAAGISPHPLSHEDVKAVADEASERFKRTVVRTLELLGGDA
jgi:purine-nucleoside phosphorylase